MKKFVSTIFAILFFSLSSYGQYREHFMFIQNTYRLLNLEKSFFLNSEFIFTQNAVQIKWSIVDDSIPGYYFVYKSYNFEQHVAVGCIEHFPQVKKGKILKFSVIDHKWSDRYNFYHIIKISKKEGLFVKPLNIKEEALANIRFCPNDDRPPTCYMEFCCYY